MPTDPSPKPDDKSFEESLRKMVALGTAILNTPKDGGKGGKGKKKRKAKRTPKK